MNEITTRNPDERIDAATIFRLVSGGDCSKLSPKQTLLFYRIRCEAAGLDYRTTLFEFLRLQGRAAMGATFVALLTAWLWEGPRLTGRRSDVSPDIGERSNVHKTLVEHRGGQDHPELGVIRM